MTNAEKNVGSCLKLMGFENVSFSIKPICFNKCVCVWGGGGVLGSIKRQTNSTFNTKAIDRCTVKFTKY